MKQSRRGMLFFLPSFLGVGVFFVLPFLGAIYYMFTKGVAQKHFVGLQNFTDLLKSPAFRLAARNTLVFIGCGVPLLLISALALSLVMTRRPYKFARWAILSALVVPVASALVGWGVIFGPQGLLNRGLEALGVGTVDFLGGKYALWTMLFIFVVKNLGYMTVIFSGAMGALSKEYQEAFLLDSGSLLTYARKIVIPLISPIIFFAAILATVGCFQIFREIYALHGDNPPDSLYMLQTFMNNNFYKLNYQRLSTAAFMVVLLVSTFVGLYLWRFGRKEVGSK